MEADLRGWILWDLFVLLHAVFKKALPKNVDGNEVDLSTKNNITKIRHHIRAIPLILPGVELDLARLDKPNFFWSLHALLEVLETLVSNDIRKDYVTQLRHVDGSQEHSEYKALRVKLPNLMTMMSVLSSAKLNPNLLRAPSKSHREAIVKLSGYVDFMSLQRRQKYSLPEIINSLRGFRSAVDKLFRDPIEALERNIGNATLLAHDETGFIRKAHHFNKLAKKLFSLLVGNITCSGAHAAQLHLSGFLTSEACFEVLISDCRKEQWHSATYRWSNTPRRSSKRCDTEHILCTQQRDQTTSGCICVAFDGASLWNDETKVEDAHVAAVQDRDQTLLDLILQTGQDAIPEASKLKMQEKKSLELLVACSLLNLDTSHWIRLGFDVDKISVRVLREASNLSDRWKPHITSFLQMADDDDDENAAVISFGLLIMQMEANRIAKPTVEDQNWDRDGISRDSLLKRILEEWADDVEDDYKDIATACLLFQQLSERFYDPLLAPETHRTGAIYKYILAPLFRLVIRQFRKSRDLFPGIPKSAYSRSVTVDNNLRTQRLGSDMILFDGSEVALPTHQRIDNSKKFMKHLETFAEQIQQITDTSSHPPHWAPWRMNPIRIAILDTGIDSKEDLLVRTALESGRIKECCGFVIDRDSDPESVNFHDANGHGTHVARLVLNAAPSAEIFIAKISDQATVSSRNLHRIAKAIKWAIEKNVNIISMSFGLDVRDMEIDRAIHAAVKANISIFAAAANNGGNNPRTYPSNRKHGVLCIHASDGVGNDGGISPTPLRKRDNFSTLGIAIPSRWKGTSVYISGTSFATPIAAALAADVLEFARHKCDLDEHQQEVLHHFDGVRQILGLMVEQEAEPRGGYDYVMPFHLWTANRSDYRIAEIITDIANT